MAFVGVKRKYRDLDPAYIYNFNRYHLELPFYYSLGDVDVTISTVDMTLGHSYFQTVGDGLRHPKFLEMKKEEEFVNSSEKFDVVVHWRKWFPELYRPEAVNVINCQDHSFSQEWKTDVLRAYHEGKLRGILCFPTWHKRNLAAETGIPEESLFDGVTLGVDSNIYMPSAKNTFQMLWASDPGRGLQHALELAMKLWRKDRRFVLNVCFPDYVNDFPWIHHPAIKFRGKVPNGPELWKLFNESTFLPYTSTFMEPSSRAHRQAQAAGAMVLYPPGMGSPSELIVDGQTGVVSPVSGWEERILSSIESKEYEKIGSLARDFAVSEDWSVQTKRFIALMERLVGEKE